jgi:hypothetical protein
MAASHCAAGYRFALLASDADGELLPRREQPCGQPRHQLLGAYVGVSMSSIAIRRAPVAGWNAGFHLQEHESLSAEER